MSDKPITPKKAAELAKQSRITDLPQFVIRAVNGLITSKLKNGAVNIMMSDLIEKILDEMEMIHGTDRVKNRKMIIDNDWLEIDEAFQAAGWRVDFDRPGYNESYQANWNFYSNQ